MRYKDFLELDNKISEVFNDYPIDERKKIIVHNLQTQIRTIESNKDALRKNCIKTIQDMKKWQDNLYETLKNLLTETNILEESE